MSPRKLASVLLLVAGITFSGGPARAICGFPGLVITSAFPLPAGPPDTGWVVLFSPLLAGPFPLAVSGWASIPLDTAFGMSAYNTGLAAVTSVPPNFMVMDAACDLILCDLSAPTGYCGPAVAAAIFP